MECPRWRLIEPHYINCPELPDGTKVQWEHKEASRETGRVSRHLFEVPLLLDPRDPADHNHLGEIIVSRQVDGARFNQRDIIFLGDPTPGMEPLNEEAEAITASLRQRWEHPIDTLPVNGGMNAQEQAFMENMVRAFAQQVGAGVQTPNTSVPREQYDELKERLARLEAALAAQNTAAPEPTAATPGRRV